MLQTFTLELHIIHVVVYQLKRELWPYRYCLRLTDKATVSHLSVVWLICKKFFFYLLWIELIHGRVVDKYFWAIAAPLSFGLNSRSEGNQTMTKKIVFRIWFLSCADTGKWQVSNALVSRELTRLGAEINMANY